MNDMTDGFVCKIAGRDELLRIWEYLTAIHP